MKKHELLEKAMRDYPKGKKIIPPFLKYEYVSTGIFRLDSQNDIEMMDEGVPILLIYTHSEVNEGTWAEIIPEKPERKFIMKSEDGVDLYEGDEQFVANKDEENKWFLLKNCRPIMVGDEKSIWLHTFSIREAAEKWIEEQNKPKRIKIELKNGYACIEKNKFELVLETRDGLSIEGEDLKKAFNAYKSLQ